MVKLSIKNFNWKALIGVVITIIIGMLAGAGVDLAVRPTQDGDVIIEATQAQTLELPEATVIETEEGEIQVIDAPVVEAVEGNEAIDECPEGEEECGQGRYVYVPTETPAAFMNYTIGQCLDVDGAYGGQCWDSAAAFWMNYTKNGRTLSTCGTGAAKGAWDCKEQNAGDEFELVTDPTQLQTGDWIIFGGGTWGHVGMAMGGYENGYIALLGQNQGGTPCAGGGAAGNIIKISLKDFRGAFRPKTYIKEDPAPVSPVIPVTGCVEWHVLRGDTMSKIMLECENTVVYGEPMNAYARTWFSRIVKPGQSVYEGWASPSGVGLYENDWIDHEVGE